MEEQLEQPETQAVVPTQQTGIVMPAVASGKEAVEAWKQYEDVKASILDPRTDVQVIQNREFKKKSYWKKLTTFFNLTVTIVEERKVQGATDDPMDFVYHFTVRALAPNGRYVDAVGSCASYEKADWHEGAWMNEEKKWNGKFMAGTGKWVPAQPNSEHNVRGTAYTRASNRAVSDLVGGGEVSAEEINDRDSGYYEEPPKPKAKPKAAPKKEEAPLEADWISEATGNRTDEDVAAIYEWGEQAGHSKEKVEAMVYASFKTRDLYQLTNEQYDRIIVGLQRQAGEK